MELNPHDLPALFAQLGLPDDTESIERFTAQHRPLPLEVDLFNAPFWTPAQATALREMLVQDADWAVAVDLLNHKLRGDPPV